MSELKEKLDEATVKAVSLGDNSILIAQMRHALEELDNRLAKIERDHYRKPAGGG